MAGSTLLEAPGNAVPDFDFAELGGCITVAKVRSIILKGTEAIAKLAGKASFFLECCLTKRVARKDTCNWLFYAVFIQSFWY